MTSKPVRRFFGAALAASVSLIGISALAASRRVLPPGAAPIITRSFARAAPLVRLTQASIAADHVDAAVCAEARCFALRLDDPRGGCAGSAAGPFCLHFPSEAPAAAREALVRAFAAEPEDACWLDLTVREEPPETRDPAEAARGGGAVAGSRAHWLAWLALTIAPVLAGALLGEIAARIRRRPLQSKAVGIAIIAGAMSIAGMVSQRQLVLGIWDLVLAGLLLGAGAVLTAYRLVPALRTKHAVLAFTSIGFALLTAESALRLFAPPAPGIDPAELHRVYLDPHEADIAYTRFELWSHAGPSADWTKTLKDALYPGPDGRFFAERAGSADRLRSAQRKVLHLGDSMVFGLGVERAEAFPAVLESMEPGSLHVNTGIPGLAPDVELLLMRRWIARMSFDLVVVHLFTGNDIKEMDTAYPFCADGPLLGYEASSPRERCPEPSTRFARSRLSWILAHSPPPYALRALAGSSQVARRSALGLLALRSRVFGERREEEQSWAHLEAVLCAFRDELGSRGIPLVVDVLPLRDALEARDATITEAWATRARMLETAQRLGIRTLDPWGAFAEVVQRDGSDAWFSTAMRHDLHFGPRGHGLLARWLHERLAQP